MTLTLILTLVGAGASLVYPIAFRVLVNGLIDSNGDAIAIGAMVVGVFYGVMWASGILLAVEGVSLVDRVGFYLSCRGAELVTALRGIEHFERADYLRELDLLNQNRRAIASGPRQLMLFLQVVVRSVGIVVLLMTIDLRLGGVALFAVPAVAAARSSASRQERTDELLVEDLRLTNELFGLAVSAAAAKEVRTFGLLGELHRRHDAAASRVTSATVAAAARNLAIGVLGWGLYGAGLVAVLFVLVDLVRQGDATIGDLLLAITLIRQVQQQVSRVSEISGQLLLVVRVAGRFLWLEREATGSRAAEGSALPPARLARGIELDGVSFGYPGADGEVLHRVSLCIPAGRTVAIVGDNGAGKTTLVKLLTGMYEPTEGRVLVDGVDMRTMASDELRGRLSAAFQDFYRFEFIARETVGIGDLTRLDDDVAVAAALDRAGTANLVQELPNALDTELGTSFVNGAQLSGGQWQKLAVSRAMMRDAPLLLVLDEPTASLDAAAEHDLFERYANASRRAGSTSGAVTLLVSHRFSTVRRADLIVVLERGKLVEVGDHEELMATGGLYAELYTIQARAYH